MHDYGELYAGSLDHNAAGLTGPSAEPYVPMDARGKASGEAPAEGTIFFRYEEETGRVHFNLS